MSIVQSPDALMMEMEAATSPRGEAMKPLMVDLYGDGEVLRLVEDTPENRKAILEWDEQGAPMDFSSFCERNGIKEIEFETLVLRNT